MKPETKQELRDRIARHEHVINEQQRAIGELGHQLVQNLYLDHAEIALILDLLFHAGIDIRSDYQSIETELPEGLDASSATLRALYQQEGRIKKLANKIKGQSFRDYDFDVELQAVVPVDPSE